MYELNEEQTKELKGLVKFLVTTEAREIYHSLRGKRKFNKFNQNPELKSLSEVKKEIYGFFQNNRMDFNPELLKRYMIEHIDRNEAYKIATANPSFKILREKVEKGEYDFNSG